jgi:hypothetical protein
MVCNAFEKGFFIRKYIKIIFFKIFFVLHISTENTKKILI